MILQGTLTAFSALSQGKLLDTLRSAALLAPVAFLSRIPSLLTRAIADIFLAEVTQALTYLCVL